MYYTKAFGKLLPNILPTTTTLDKAAHLRCFFSWEAMMRSLLSWHNFKCSQCCCSPPVLSPWAQASHTCWNRPLTLDTAIEIFPNVVRSSPVPWSKASRRGGPSSKLSLECWNCVTKQWKAALSTDIYIYIERERSYNSSPNSLPTAVYCAVSLLFSTHRLSVVDHQKKGVEFRVMLLCKCRAIDEFRVQLETVSQALWQW